jgi:hypothetical protein
MFSKRLIPWIISLFVSICLIVSLLNEVLNQVMPYRWEKFATLALLSLVFTPLLYLVLYRWAWRRLTPISMTTRIAWLFFSVLIAWVIFAVLPPAEPRYSHNLDLHSIGAQNPSSQSNRVQLLSISSSVGLIQPPALVLDSNWESTSNGHIASHFPAQASWAGLISGDLTLSFSAGPDAGQVEVVWDGQAQQVDLYWPIEAKDQIILSGRLVDEGSFSRQLILAGLSATDIFLIWLPVFLAGIWIGMIQVHL